MRSGTAEHDFGHEAFAEKWRVVDDADLCAFVEIRGRNELRACNKASARIPNQGHRRRIIRAAQLKCFRSPVEVLNDSHCIPTEPRQRERIGTADDGCGEE